MRCITAVCVALGTTAAFGCAPSDASCDGPCGTVVVDAWGAPEALLPVFTTSMDALAISSVMFLPLAEIGSDMNIVGDEGFEPRLARSWTFEDPVTIAFEMDPNARWHDGQPVTAYDVAFTFDLYRDPVINSDEEDDLRSIRAVTARDEHTVAFSFSRAYQEQFFDATYHMRIHPAHLLDTIPRASLQSHPLARNPTGNGPFRLVRWDADQTVELIADTAFFLERPGPARIVVQVIPNPNTILARMMAEESDFSVFIPPPFVNQIQEAQHLTTIGYPSSSYSFVWFNFRDPNDVTQPHPLFRHRYIREALSIAVDREAISQATMGDFGSVPSGPMSRNNPLWDLDIPTIPYDTARARQLLVDGGWSDSDDDGILDKNGQPLSFELILPSSSGSRRQAATIMESQFRQIGVEMRIREMDSNTHIEQTQRGRFDASFFAWSQDPKPSGSIGGTWSTTGANNYSKYSNPRFDSLVTATTSGTDPERIRQTWREALGVIQQDWPAIWMLTLTQVSGVHSRFENVVVRPDQNWGATIWRWRVRPGHMLPRDRVGIQ
ncbi:MAG: hypothetical protein IH798_06605 [Gemmatimonadetes bacterium]|nr:hypothetical protein [Gemmatimonadota bacterium]